MVDSSELQQRERELAELRSRAINSLEQQLASREQELTVVTEQFEALKADFTYNLDLLRQRDEELAAYDESAAQSAAQEAALRNRTAELELFVAKLQSELQATRAAAEQQDFLLAAKRAELARLLEEERLGRTEALLRQKEQAEAVRRGLQNELEELREQAERQRRTLQSAFQQQLHEAQAALGAEAAELKQTAATATRLAEQRQQELQVLTAREAEARQQAEAARAALRERDVTLRGLELELEVRGRDHDVVVVRMQQQVAEAQQKLKIASDSYDTHRAQLASQLATAQQCLDELRSQCLQDIALLQRRHGEEVLGLRGRLEAAGAHVQQLEEEVREVRSQLRAAMEHPRTADLERQLAEQRAITEALRQEKDAMDQRLREAAIGSSQTVASLHQELETARAAAEEGRRELMAAREQADATAERERALQRRLNALEAARLGSSGGVADGVATGTSGHASTGDVRFSQASQQQPTVAPARGRVGIGSSAALHDKGPSDGGGLPIRDRAVDGEPLSPALRSGGTGAGQGPRQPPFGLFGRPAVLSLAALQDSHDSLPDLNASPLLDLPPSPRSSASFWLGPSSVGPGGGHGTPSGTLQDAPRPWSPAAAAAAAAAPAARAAQYLRSSREGLDSLLKPTARSRLGLSDGAQHNTGQSQGGGQEAAEAAANASAALAEAEAENQRLRSTLAVMRSEMEALQAAAGAAADSVLAHQSRPVGRQTAGAPWGRELRAPGGEGSEEGAGSPGGGGGGGGGGRGHPPTGGYDNRYNVDALRTELEESDKDLQQATEHVELLQRQLQALRAGINHQPPATTATAPHTHPPGSAAGTAPSTLLGMGLSPEVQAAVAAEVSFLRRRVKELTSANRVLRRAAMQHQAATAAGAAVAAAGSGSGGGTTSSGSAGAVAIGEPQGGQAVQADVGVTGVITEEGETQQQQQLEPATSLAQLQHQVAQLETDLERAHAALATARSENERLMELSCEVRAQRDRVAMQLAAVMANVAATSMGAMQGPPGGEGAGAGATLPGVWNKQGMATPHLPTSYGSPFPASPPPQPHPGSVVMGGRSASPVTMPLPSVMASAAGAPGYMFGFQGAYGPQALGMPSPCLPWPPLWGPVGVVRPVDGEGDAVRKSAREQEGRADSSREEQFGQGAETSSRSPSPPIRRAAGSPTRHGAGDLEGKEPRRSRSPPSPPLHPPASHNGAKHRHASQQHRALVSSLDLAAAMAKPPGRAAAGNVLNAEGAGINITTVTPNGVVGGTADVSRSASFLPSGNNPSAAGVGARPSPPVGLTASGRETQSQRAALRALHRRREQQQNQVVAAVNAAAELRQRVRNYSMVRLEGSDAPPRTIGVSSD